jgi:Family of unknown function (DUF5343)
MALTMQAPPLPPQDSQSAVPPYAPYRSFRNFIDSLKQGIPARIDRSVMASMSGALQSQLTLALRFLGLIKPTGQPTDLLALLVNSEGPARAKAMSQILHESYPFLFNDFALSTATPRMLEERFSEQGASGGTLDKCMLFFTAAAKEAGIELSPHLKTQRGGSRTVRTRPARQARGADAGQSDDTILNNGGESGDLSWSQMLLSKFPSFDPAWPDEVKVKWFDGFHRLMRMKEGDQE